MKRGTKYALLIAVVSTFSISCITLFGFKSRPSFVLILELVCLAILIFLSYKLGYDTGYDDGKKNKK